MQPGYYLFILIWMLMVAIIKIKNIEKIENI